MKKKISIIGAGIMGMTLGYRLMAEGHDVTLYEKSGPDLVESASFWAGGMLAPYCELETAEPLIAQLGEKSIDLWQDYIEEINKNYPVDDVLGHPVYFQKNGSMVVAHNQDEPELFNLFNRISHTGFGSKVVMLDGAGITKRESDLKGRFNKALYFKDEAQIGPRSVLYALRDILKDRIHFHTMVDVPEDLEGDIIIDCRGLGGKSDNDNLRGVRGEMLLIHAPDVALTRPIRMMHPRYPIYIIPRPNGHYMIGATQLESEDAREMTVRSALELLSAAYSLHPAFSEAEILEFGVSFRPAYADNLPKIKINKNVISVNGLYRHGFLLAPALTEHVLSYLDKGHISEEAQELFEEA